MGLSACGPRDAGTERTAAPAPSAAPRPEIDALRRAEYTRRADGVPPESLTNRDVAVRRAAARALARIAERQTEARLLKALSDEDSEVVAWAAYGLGYVCSGNESTTVRSLVARAAALAVSPPDAPPPARFSIEPWDALADALGRCGTAQAEQTLRAWLAEPPGRAESAALALGRLAGRRHRLDDATQVALLEARARAPGVPSALHAFGRLDAVSEPVRKRLLEVAVPAARGGGPDRTLAIRALGAAGAAAEDTLVEILTNTRAGGAERSTAATVLGRQGPEAMGALARALGSIVEKNGPLDARWLAVHFSPLTAALATMLPPAPEATEPLATLADLALPDGANAAERRRRVALRCASAAILAGTASQSARLVACDPDPKGQKGALAVLRVLDRGELRGPRLARFRELAASPDPAVRRAALAILPMHPELPPMVDLLTASLAAKEPGVVAQAAKALASEPRLGREERPAAKGEPEAAPAASPAIVEALGRALDADRPPDQVETRSALARAAAAVGALSLKGRIENLCRHPNVTLRRSAEAALRSFGSSGAACAAPPPGDTPVTIPPPRRPVTLTFVTDSGRFGIVLDPALAPLSVERIVDLAKAGFYDRLPIHRVTPGSAVQLGDPVGDGYGGSGRVPLPCETSPVGFEALSVGLALSGRDTGSSQIFVTLAEEPQLYGDYAKLGSADADWGNVAEGDVVNRVEVKE